MGCACGSAECCQEIGDDKISAERFLQDLDHWRAMTSNPPRSNEIYERLPEGLRAKVTLLSLQKIIGKNPLADKEIDLEFSAAFFEEYENEIRRRVKFVDFNGVRGELRRSFEAAGLRVSKIHDALPMAQRKRISQGTLQDWFNNNAANCIVPEKFVLAVKNAVEKAVKGVQRNIEG